MGVNDWPELEKGLLGGGLGAMAPLLGASIWAQIVPDDVLFQSKVAAGVCYVVGVIMLLCACVSAARRGDC